MPVTQLGEQVLAVLNAAAGRPLKAKDISRSLDLPADDRGDIRQALFDLVDDGLALELALDAAMDGRLALCVFRAPSAVSAVHRASVLDARFHRRRLSEGLAALSYQRLANYDSRYALEIDFHLPSIALRRHLRAHETPPPPVVFETE
jgi:hypothetical protein